MTDFIGLFGQLGNHVDPEGIHARNRMAIFEMAREVHEEHQDASLSDCMRESLAVVGPTLRRVQMIETEKGYLSVETIKEMAKAL